MAFNEIDGDGDINRLYTEMSMEYGDLMQKTVITILKQYDDAVTGFYGNAKANLEVYTKTMFDYGIEGVELIQNMKLYLKRYTSNYNPDIEWQVFMYYNANPYPLWCLNCFMFSDPVTQ
jgi:hypothetical protein